MVAGEEARSAETEQRGSIENPRNFGVIKRIRKFLFKRFRRESTSELKEVNMLARTSLSASSFTKVDPNFRLELGNARSKLEVNFNQTSKSDVPVIFIDSCASGGMVILSQEIIHLLRDVEDYSGDEHIQLTGAGQQMVISKTGTLGAMSNCYICPMTARNICAVSRLHDMGYGLRSDRQGTTIYAVHSGSSVITCGHLNGMPYVGIPQIMDLPDISEQQEVHLVQIAEGQDM